MASGVGTEQSGFSDDSASEMRFGFRDEAEELTEARNTYRRAKISQSERERHLVRTNPSQLEEGKS